MPLSADRLQRGGCAPAERAARLLTTLTDEHGRLWVMPKTTAQMKQLLNTFGVRHGWRPSRAFGEAFRRHRQLDQARLLVLRGAEGERLNLATRALALGPLPPAPARQVTASQLARCPDLPQRLQAWQDALDQDTLKDLHDEARRLAALGYLA